MTNIKPIETVYNGYRFRSRLEARAAVFLDNAPCRYEYEVEGYQLSDGRRYLPDFYLPDDKYYVEVKGYSDHLFDDLKKAEAFVYEAKTALIIISEIPYDVESKGLYLFPSLSYSAKSGGIVENQHAFFMTDPDTGKAYIQDNFAIGRKQAFVYEPYAKLGSGVSKNDYAYSRIHPLNGSGYGVDESAFDDWDTTVRTCFDLSKIQNAFLAARQARFEYGETPSL